MQPLVKAMPEVMGELPARLAGDPAAAGGDGAGIAHPPGLDGLCRILAAGGRGGRGVRGWVYGCGNAPAGCRSCDPRLAKAIHAMHQRRALTGKWKIWRGRRRAVALFAERFLPPPAPPRPLSHRAAYAAGGAVHHPRPRRWKKSPSASGISRWRPSARRSTHHRPAARSPCARRYASVSLYAGDTRRCRREALLVSAGLATRNTSSASWLAGPRRKVNHCRPRPARSPWAEAQQCLPAVAHRLRIAHLEHPPRTQCRPAVMGRPAGTSGHGRGRASRSRPRLLPLQHKGRPARRCRHR